MPPLLNPSTRNIQLEAGDPEAWSWIRQKLSGNIASSTPTESPYVAFGLRLMDMLKQYQQLGTAKFQEAALRGKEEQAQRIMAPAEPGMPPSLQSQIRSAQASAITPVIEGAQQMGKTLSEQIAGLGDVLQQATAIGKWLEQSEQQKKQDLLNTLWKFPEAFKAIDSKLQAEVERTLGLPKGFIQNIPVETKKRNTQVVTIGDRQKLIDLDTGETIKDLGPTAITQKDIESLEAKQKVKSEALTNLNNIRQLLESPGLSKLSGAIQGFLPAITPDVRYAKKLYEQIKNTLTVANRQKLKGQGTVSDWEGKLLESASTALDRRLKDEDFVRELKKIKAAFSAYAGLPVEVKITDPKTRAIDEGILTPEEVEDAIAQGYLVEFK